MTTPTAHNVWQSEDGSDILQIRNPKGQQVICGIDAFGKPIGNLNNAFFPPSTKIVFVDGNRTDAYIPDGSLLKPFKTIMDAVNLVATIGDNSASVPYVIYISPKTYPETIVLENSALVYLIFHGLGTAVVSGGIQSLANNSNLQQVDFRSINFTGGTVSLSGSGNFLANGINFFDLYISGMPTWTHTGSAAQFFDVSFSVTTVTLTSSTYIFMGNRGPNTGGTFNLNSNTLLSVQRGSRCGFNVNIDATSSYSLNVGSRQDFPVVVNGTFTNRGQVTFPITVNSGGTYTETGGTHTNTLTVNAGGTYNQAGSLGLQALQIGGIHVSTGSVTPNGAVSGNPGDLYVDTSGGSLTTFWVKETGTGTNTGWVGK